MEANLNSKKTILILGSGMMVEPLIDFLLERKDNCLIIGTNLMSSFNSIFEKRQNANLQGVEIDVVKNETLLLDLVGKSDIVISYLPPILHEYIARACLQKKKNMVTTSYIGDFMKKVSQEVKEKNIIFMNEIGLDPGIDHLITHKVIHECEKKGNKILKYESWCGALCSPEFLNNPILYKFSWSPRGALNALRNNVKQMINGKEVNLSNQEFLKHTVNKNFHPCFNFEGYYNRDSLNYKDLYNLKDAHTVIRGTIRFKGFGFIFQCFKTLGLFDDEYFSHFDARNADLKSGNNKFLWKDHFYKNVICKSENAQKVENFKRNYIEKHAFNISQFLLNENKSKSRNFEEMNFYVYLTLLSLSYLEEEYLNMYGFENLFKKFHSVIQYLEFFENQTIIKDSKILDSFAILLEDKLKMQTWERDLVFMQNEFTIQTKHGDIQNKKYDLVVFGGHNKMPYSATSVLVSLPCATATQVNRLLTFIFLNFLIRNNKILVDFGWKNKRNRSFNAYI